MAFFVRLVLGENAAQIGQTRLGRAVRLFARPPRQFLLAHRHPGPVSAHIQDGHRAAAGLRLPFLPVLGRGSHPLHQALHLPGADLDAPGFRQVLLGFLVTGFIGPLQTDQPGQSRGVARLQAQRGIGGIMPLLFAFMVVVSALQGEGAKHARELELGPALGLLARLGLVGGIDPIRRPLQQKTHQRVGRLEDGGAHQHFQLLDGHPIGLARLETSHQLLDFLVLGQEQFRAGAFFFDPGQPLGTGLVHHQLDVLPGELLEAMVFGDRLFELGHLFAGNIAGNIVARFVTLVVVVRPGGAFADDADGASVHALNLGDGLEQ